MEKKQSPSVDDHALVKMEKSVFRGMKKKRGSKKLVVRGVTHWIKVEDDDRLFWASQLIHYRIGGKLFPSFGGRFFFTY